VKQDPLIVDRLEEILDTFHPQNRINGTFTLDRRPDYQKERERIRAFDMEQLRKNTNRENMPRVPENVDNPMLAIHNIISRHGETYKLLLKLCLILNHIQTSLDDDAPGPLGTISISLQKKIRPILKVD
ncbi:MAG: hypothetical protein ACRYGG_06145, partial [Janthinobacterium lividum]